MATRTQVLVVGGSLNGLTTGLLLADLGVDCIVVERHPGTAIQYKFAGISPRSMEIFRGLGIEDEIRANKTGDQQAGGIARGRTLSDPDLTWMRGSAWPDVTGLSPTPPATCDQHVLEPILRAHAERRGADVRFNTELVSFAQSDDRIDAIVRDRATGRDEHVQADYLVAADGANGSVREMLGIDRDGPGVLQHWMNIVFDTDLEPVLQGKRMTSCFVMDLNATFTAREGGRWLLALQYAPEKGETPESFDAEKTRELVRKGAGRDDVKADLVDARPWEVAALVARRFRDRRAFLVGDAAHLMPPTGAFGGNTGIHDAHNLAWKLAAVLNGTADPALLDTYDAERRSVAQRSLDQALARLRAWFKDPSNRLPPAVPQVDDYDVVFGQRYDAGAVIAEETPPPRPFEPARELSGRPGTRAPHFTVEYRGQRMSTLDLFGKRFVLLAGPESDAWCDAARRLGIECRRFGSDLVDVDRRWPSAFGVTDAGAVLVRPDDVVAWRSAGTSIQPARMLHDVCARLGLRVRLQQPAHR
ncbi:MAG TPA: FAD-dependent monooxygenase [Vicinamibacterales bacterium]|nr:FAD-dependent monooxygenase [Vicinamibacterales bacterium]